MKLDELQGALPGEAGTNRTSAADAADAAAGGGAPPPGFAGRPPYLVYFAHRHLDFRLAEFEAAASMAPGAPADGPHVAWGGPVGGHPASPLWRCRLRSEAAAVAAAARAHLLRAVIEPWAEGDTLDKLLEALDKYPETARAPYVAPSVSWRFCVDAFGRKLPEAHKVALIERFERPLRARGPTDLVRPDVVFWLLELGHAHETLPPLPARWVFGRQVAAADHSALAARLDLRARRYLGPTTMDPLLAQVMCCLGRVRRGSLVLDPFAGTGGVLLAAAAWGAATLGMDIDARVIRRGKAHAPSGERVDVWTNFADAALPPPVGLLRADLHRPPLRRPAGGGAAGCEGLVDAVVCDPPYGVRAGGRKSQARPLPALPPGAEHFPATAPYAMGECLRDLLDLAARLLAPRGRLVFWAPAAEGLYDEAQLPRHPALEYVANCEQVLHSRYSRRLCAMEKVRPYDAAAAAAHHAAAGPPAMAIDDVAAVVFAPREAAGKGKGKGKARGAGAALAPGDRFRRCKAV